MHKSKFKFLGWLMVSVLFVNSAINSISVNATSVKDLQQKQEQVKTQAKTARDALAETQTEKNQTLNEIIQLDIELEEVNEEYYAVSDELEKTEALLAQAEEELEVAIEKREQQFESLKSRIKFMYENGKLSYLEILFSSASLSDLLNNAEYVDRIVEYDSGLVEELQKTEDEIAEKVETIATKKMEIAVLASQLETKKLALEAMVEKKQDAVNQLDSDEQKYSQQIAALENSSKEIENLIKAAEKKAADERIKNASVATFSGTMQWPVPSSFRVTSGYGYRTHPINGKREFHTGVDIGASYGANVTAAAKGTVIYAGYNGGYGNCVIIEHGSGLSTLYAHNSKLVVKAGDYVEQGQVVSKIGSTGYSTGNHLHFEVRKNGNHTSPKNYLNY